MKKELEELLVLVLQVVNLILENIILLLKLMRAKYRFIKMYLLMRFYLHTHSVKDFQNALVRFGSKVVIAGNVRIYHLPNGGKVIFTKNLTKNLVEFISAKSSHA